MKSVHKGIILSGFMIAAVGLLISGFAYDDFVKMFFRTSSVYNTSTGYMIVVISILGVCFTFAQNKTLINFGTAFSAFSGILGFFIFSGVLQSMKNTYNYKGEILIVVAVGLIIMLLGAIVKLIMDFVFGVQNKE